MTEIRYVGATRSLVEVSTEIDAIFTELGDDPGVRGERSAEEWQALRDDIELQGDGTAGFDPATVGIVVAFALNTPAVNHILTSLWDEFILPRLRFRLGEDAIGQEQRRK